MSWLASSVIAGPQEIGDSSQAGQLSQLSSGDNTEETLEARAQRATIESSVHAFVSGVTRPYGGRLARWHRPICPLVAGLSREKGEFVLARVSEIATAAGAPLGPHSCAANFLVVLTPKPYPLLKAWYWHDRNLYRDALPSKVRNFLKTPRPVRAWYNAELRSVDDLALNPDAGAAVDASAVNDRPRRSRIEWNEYPDLESVILIVDTNRANGVTVGQLADYVAMAGLTELDLDADVADAPTILRLFAASNPDAAPTGLSDWDQAFLKALYQTRQTSMLQRSQIVESVLRDVAR